MIKRLFNVKANCTQARFYFAALAPGRIWQLLWLWIMKLCAEGLCSSGSVDEAGREQLLFADIERWRLAGERGDIAWSRCKLMKEPAVGCLM